MINAILQTNAMRRNSTFPAAVRKLPVDARQRKRDSELAFEQLFQKRRILSGRDRRAPAVRREGYRNVSRIRQESPEFSHSGNQSGTADAFVSDCRISAAGDFLFSEESSCRSSCTGPCLPAESRLPSLQMAFHGIFSLRFQFEKGRRKAA